MPRSPQYKPTRYTLDEADEDREILVSVMRRIEPFDGARQVHIVANLLAGLLFSAKDRQAMRAVFYDMVATHLTAADEAYAQDHPEERRH